MRQFVIERWRSASPPRWMPLSAALALILAGTAASAQPEESAEFVVERIHSNLPLYTFDWEDLWPRSFSDDDSFGCATRVAFGDWKLVFVDTPDGSRWDRYTNYGVFHCAAILRAAEDRASLGVADWEYGFFVRVGEARREAEAWELWAIQQGINPGSDYILLARPANPDGLVEKFWLLQQRCPEGKLLEAEHMDIWSTRYCAINSRAELLALANDMLKLPLRGTIERVGDAQEEGASDRWSDAFSE